MSEGRIAKVAGIIYTDGDRQRVQHAFSEALDRLSRRSRPLSDWEGGQMLRALSAMATGAYTIAEGSIQAALTRSPPEPETAADPMPVTVEGLREGFREMVVDARHQ